MCPQTAGPCKEQLLNRRNLDCSGLSPSSLPCWRDRNRLGFLLSWLLSVLPRADPSNRSLKLTEGVNGLIAIANGVEEGSRLVQKDPAESTRLLWLVTILSLLSLTLLTCPQ